MCRSANPWDRFSPRLHRLRARRRALRDGGNERDSPRRQQSALRKLLIDKRQRIIQQLNTDSNYTVIIHPSSATSYKEIIDVLDEMKINDIRKYILLDTEIAKQ